MLKELGMFGALVGFGLVFAQLGQVFGWSNGVVWGLTGAVVVIFAAITKSFGRFLLAFLIIIMMPQATTELGTNGWITSLMADADEGRRLQSRVGAGLHVGHHGGAALFRRAAHPQIFAGRSAGGVLGACRARDCRAVANRPAPACCVIFAAATLYGVGITFFWPTILGLTSEQCPHGGALTLNAMGGIGMLAVGILGAPVPRLLAGNHRHAAVARHESRALPTGERGEEILARRL